ncbi:hypothetical protein N5K55_21780 [Pseudomonas aeruginosa]|nr:hypothetical protein [Pseudomonas aeruginosa]
MKIAQRLPRQGLITYHRTDSPNIRRTPCRISVLSPSVGLKCVEQQRMFKADQDARKTHLCFFRLDSRYRWVKLLMSRPCTSSFSCALASQIEAAVCAVRIHHPGRRRHDKKPLR